MGCCQGVWPLQNCSSNHPASCQPGGQVEHRRSLSHPPVQGQPFRMNSILVKQDALCVEASQARQRARSMRPFFSAARFLAMSPLLAGLCSILLIDLPMLLLAQVTCPVPACRRCLSSPSTCPMRAPLHLTALPQPVTVAACSQCLGCCSRRHRRTSLHLADLPWPGSTCAFQHHSVHPLRHRHSFGSADGALLGANLRAGGCNSDSPGHTCESACWSAGSTV